MLIRGVLGAVVAGAALMTAGCGRDLDSAKVATTSGVSGTSGASLSAEQRAAIRASQALTKPGSPASVVMTFVEDLRDGAGPALLPFYDSRISHRIGLGSMVGALQVMTAITATTRPVVTRSHTTRAGELVIVRLLRTDGSDGRYSFLLRREGRSWKIAYDSLMLQGLQSYVTSRESGNSGKPSSEATRAAARAVTEMQLATLYEPPRRPRRAAAARAAKARPAARAPAAGAGASSGR
jgi:hypothetical protein